MKKLLLFVLIIVIITMLGSCLGDSTSSSSSSKATCGSCGRSYSAGDSGGNYRSIAWTGMCKNCYNNFKWAQSALDGLK